MIKVRLQGGPFDGEKAHVVEPELPERIWVRPCWQCGSRWCRIPVQGGELYRRDSEDPNGWLVYVYTDETLGDRVWTSERETVPARAAS